MIKYPTNWESIGRPEKIGELERRLFTTIKLQCSKYLALSGGLDSTLILAYMTNAFDGVEAFTIGTSEDHPDVKYARMAVRAFPKTKHRVYIPTQKEIDEEKNLPGDFRGDKAVRLFYKFVGKYTKTINSGDGVDEFMCGYYAHQKSSTRELTYYEYIRRLYREQLKPLDRNSQDVGVFLPYLQDDFVGLLSRIPTYEKVTAGERKCLMVEMARGVIPNEIIDRWKYGFCDALKIKKAKNEN